jgi:hypothetical protein
VAARQLGHKEFHTKIDGSEKGRVYIPLPFDPVEVWGARVRFNVSGTVNGMKVRGRLEQSGKGYFLPLGPAWRRDTGLRPGDAVQVALSEERPPRSDLASDVAAALDAEPEAGRIWDGLAGFYRNGYLRWVDATRRRPEARAERIAELVGLLKGGHKQRPR